MACLLAAEAIYSSKRLNSLSEEWSQIYPSFLDIIEILRGKTANISRSTLAGESLQEVILTLYEYNETDTCIEICKKIMEPKSTIKESEIISQLLVALYKTGTIGIKISSLETFIWSYIDQPNITIGEAKRATSIKIHKMLHRALDIVLEQTDIYSNEDYI